MSRTARLALTAALLALAGCTGPRPFEDVDLSGDLAPADLARYEREWQEAQAEGQPAAMARLESSNGWPLGLVIYWRRGSVTRSTSADGAPSYTIRSAHGVGPLSAFFVSETHATFDARGKRLAAMTMGSIAFGHLAMWHIGDAVLASGRRQRAVSAHLAHHAVSIHKMDGHTSISLFSAPNPIGLDMHEGHGGH